MVKRIFRNSLLFFDLPQGDILSAGFIIMLLAMVSGIFGLIRDRLLATNFSPDLVGIYFAAFVIPDNIFQILVISAVGAAFIPVFVRYEKKGQQWELASSLLAISLITFIALAGIVFILAEPISLLLVPGVQKENPQHLALLVNLTRIILVGQIFFIFSYISTSILNSYQRFIMPALSPVFYNIGIILGILFLAPSFGMYGVAIGIVFGAFLHLLIQLPYVLRLGFSLHSLRNVFHPGIIEVARLMIPRMLSIAIERLKFTVDTILTSVISLSSITYLNFALHVATFPVSLVASAIAQAALPFFAKSVANGDREEFKKHLMLSLTHIIFLLAPISVLLVTFHTPIVRLVFGAPRFSWEATVLTARTLAILAVGLVAQGAGSILARGFYAHFDTKTPLVITLISTVTSITLSVFFVLMLRFDVRALALATTIGAVINALSLFILLDRKIGGLFDLGFLKTLAKIFIISGLLGVFSYAMLKLLEGYFNTIYTVQLIIFTILAGIISILFYLFFSIVFNLEEYKALFQFFKKAGRIRQRIMQEPEVNV